jgi:hypothetical protein
MTEIVKGVLGGGWSLLVGWILPTAVNVLFAAVLIPLALGQSALAWLGDLDTSRRAVAGLAVAVLGGLVLAAVQTPAYRVLEGYLGWPAFLGRRGRRRMLAAKRLLVDRLGALALVDAERRGELDDAGRRALAEMRAHPLVGRHVARDVRLSLAARGLLAERLRRFPADDGQVVATRLGNAIRRLEEYGYDRFRLDSQVFWYELTAVAPERATKQVDQARTTVDLFVSLLTGHVLVAAVTVAAEVGGPPERRPLAAVAALALLVLAACWYRVAVVVTDDWAAAVRALVNLGRGPLADALSLRLPARLADERRMWSAVGELTRLPYRSGGAGCDRYRAGSGDLDADGPVRPPVEADTASPT